MSLPESVVEGAQPRRVMRSAAFDQNPIAATRLVTIAEIVDQIERGADLTKYLSRRVRSSFTLPRKFGKKRLSQLEHLDLLLNDWGVHHLHLSTAVEADGFVERNDPLLFAMFRSEKAYFLDIGTHQSFADDRLVRIAVENWPSDQLFWESGETLFARRTSPTALGRTSQLRSDWRARVFSAWGHHDCGHLHSGFDLVRPYHAHPRHF